MCQAGLKKEEKEKKNKYLIIWYHKSDETKIASSLGKNEAHTQQKNRIGLEYVIKLSDFPYLVQR